jgi:hypothetical protein
MLAPRGPFAEIKEREETRYSSKREEAKRDKVEAYTRSYHK